MEVPGRCRDPELIKESQDDASEFCLPCRNEGKHVPAHGFCQTCNHNLCAACFKVHKVPLPCKKHILIHNSPASKSKPTGSQNAPATNPCTYRCQDHHEKYIEILLFVTQQCSM